MGTVILSGLKVVRVSGIYDPEMFQKQRPNVSLISKSSNKKYVGLSEARITQAIAIFHLSSEVQLIEVPLLKLDN